MRSSSSFSSIVYTALPPRGRLVAAPHGRSEGHELEPVGPRDGHPPRLRVEADEAARLELQLLAVDPQRAPALDDEHDLLLPVTGMVVLAPLLVGREDEVVEAERLRAE